jgi:YVTN family beta-propeller protein
VVYVSNISSANVSVISTATNTVIATIGVGNRPRGVAVTPDGTRVYVPNGNDNTMSEILTASNTLASTFPVTGSNDPDSEGQFIVPAAPSTPTPTPLLLAAIGLGTVGAIEARRVRRKS